VVVSGAGSITQSATSTTINQSSSNLSLTWKSFNVAPTETVNFVQPSATAVAVNRIYDTHGSQIMGRLNANGQVYLINPNGVLFGQGAQINVGALVASTLDLNEASSVGNTRSFSGTGMGSVVNLGAIDATGANGKGGFVALLGNSVSNHGSINAPGGTVALGAGSAVTLTFQGSSLVQMKIDQSELDSQSANGGVIRANGGRVLMSAGAQDALLASVVNNTGVIEARTVENHAGTIVLLGGMAAGTTHVAGTLDASAPNGGNGGFIETSAAHVKVADTARITTAAPAGKTGTWLIDPVDFTIAATDGDITGASLGNFLGSNSVTVQTVTGSDTDNSRFGTTGTNGDIFVNDPVNWSANTTLTLNAYRNININRPITATNGKLELLYGQGEPDGVIGGVSSTYNVNAPVNLSAGPNFSTQQGSAGTVKNFTVITSLGAENSTTATDLQGMRSSLWTNYALGSNIDASATAGWNSDLAATPTYAGFEPIGNISTFFGLTFDGLGHTISNLTINRPTTDYVGLFGITGVSSVIQNLGLVGGSVRGLAAVGGLVAANGGTINNTYATSAVTGLQDYVGGLVGINEGPINNSSSSGPVNGRSNVGGLVGSTWLTDVSNSYATGNVNGFNNVGGLVGSNSILNLISNSYATGTVTGNRSVGGLVGGGESSSILNSYASGAVTGQDIYVGGLLGFALNSAVSNSYATGSVSGTGRVGGLVGLIANSSTISNSYATGSVSGTDRVGGLVGENYATITGSYWNIDKIADGFGSGVTSGATGLTSTQMQDAANFTGFNFTSTPGESGNNWVIVNGDGSLNDNIPSMTPGTNGGGTTPMLASEYSLNIRNSHQLQLMAMDLAGKYTLSTNINATSTGLINGVSNDVWSGSGFVPIQNVNAPFTGTFNGQGNTISNLTINRPTEGNVGLFGYSDPGSVIQNLGLVGGSVTGLFSVGGLVGTNDGGHISNSYSTGNVSGDDSVGGLVGTNIGVVSNSYATGTVASNHVLSYLGGLVGINEGQISNSFATGNVIGVNIVGGLVGRNSYSGTVTSSYSSGYVNGSDEVGGLVGANIGNVSNSYATGLVSGNQFVGGLVGLNAPGTVSNSYATGNVTGTSEVGGLVGGEEGQISNSYATGVVVGNDFVGGLVGRKYDGEIINSYWNTTNAEFGLGMGWPDGATGLSSAQMQQQSNFSGFDFDTTWVIYGGRTKPLLRAFMTPLTVTANSINKIYDGQTTDATAGVSYSSTPNSSLLGRLDYNGEVNAGTYAPSGLYSDQQGYLISYVGGTLTINQRPLTVTADAKSKTYGDVNPALTYSLAADGVGTSRGLVNGDSLSGSLSTVATQASGAGSYTIDASALSNGNYLVTANNGTLTISPVSRSNPATGDDTTQTMPVPRFLLDDKRDAQLSQKGGADMNVRIIGPGVKLPSDMLDLSE
jgi:filamentous hemagglutinin family protein